MEGDRFSYLKTFTELRPRCGKNCAVQTRQPCLVDLPALKGSIVSAHIPTALPSGKVHSGESI